MQHHPHPFPPQGFAPFQHEALWNVDKLRLYCAGLGVRVQLGPVVELEKMLHTPALPEGALEEQVVYLPDIYTNVVDLKTFIKQARAVIRDHVVQHAKVLNEIDPEQPYVTIYPTFRLPVLMGIHLQQAPVAVEVARNLEFASQFYQLAAHAVGVMWQRSNVRCGWRGWG